MCINLPRPISVEGAPNVRVIVYGVSAFLKVPVATKEIPLTRTSSVVSPMRDENWEALHLIAMSMYHDAVPCRRFEHRQNHTVPHNHFSVISETLPNNSYE